MAQTPGLSHPRPTAAGTLSGTGWLTKIGSGTMTLTGNNSYSGDLTKIGAGTLTLSARAPSDATNVNAGILQAGVANAFSPLSAFTVASGAALVIAAGE